jgi:hypothetical protein
MLALALVPTIRRGKAVPETKAPIISIENEKRVSKSECMLAGIKMVAKAGTGACRLCRAVPRMAAMQLGIFVQVKCSTPTGG